MMGPRQHRAAKLFYVGVNLDERVGPAHPLRKVAAAVDFGFIRPAVQGRYGVRGNPSLDPTLVLKLLFLLFYENVASERELLRQLPCRLDWLWFLAMDLDSPIPDHSVLSKARRRWGPQVFAGFFQQVLGQCLAAGLVDGARVHVDGSLIAAHADQAKLTLALQLTGEALYGQLEAAAGEAGGEGTPPTLATEPATAPPLAPPVAPSVPAVPPPPPPPPPAAPTLLLRPPAIPPAPPAPGTWYCPTDPEARLTRKQGRSVLGYKDHRVVDERCGIITATLTTPASVAEASLLEAVLDAHEAHTGRGVLAPTADKGYGTVDNYLMLRARGVTPCIPHPAVREDPTKFPRTAFTYDPTADVYRCPGGQTLTRRGAPSEDRYRYQAARGVCGVCPLRAQCTASRQGRVLSRQVHQDAIDWADTCLSPGQRRARLRRRKIRAEGSFADAANHHGYKRARWRGLEQVHIQNLLIASTQNLRKLIRHGPAAPGRVAGRLSGGDLRSRALPATLATAAATVLPPRWRRPPACRRRRWKNPAPRGRRAPRRGNPRTEAN